MAKVEFVKYDCEPLSRCRGALYVKIDGKLISFNAWSDNKNIPDYPCFWESGGEVEYGEDGFIKNSFPGPWRIEHAFCDFPDEIDRLLPELLRVMNENVPWGCCGGCMFKPIEI